jgi:CRISPR-associated protein Cst2
MEMVYVRITGRSIVNIHSANAEGAVGNYIALSKMFVVRRVENGYDILEEPVISGNMIKHWHAIATVETLKSWGYKSLCDECKRHIMFRSVLGYKTGCKDEFDYIQKCAIEDLHGFLDTQTNVRRESIIKFAFMIPIEELRAEYTSITHNRVVTTPQGNVPTKEEAPEIYGVEEAMGVMKREHASGLYGFLCSMDLAFVGISQANPEKKLSLNERKIRAKAATAALIELFSGRFGAAQARASPIVKVTELICIASKKPIPNAVHGFYKDYAEETASIIKVALNQALAMPNEIKTVVVGKKPMMVFKEEGVEVEEAKTASEAVAKIMEASDKWL